VKLATSFTAPIATRARLTPYFQLEKICGRRLVTLYNIANGIMFWPTAPAGWGLGKPSPRGSPACGFRNGPPKLEHR
jgi:hypothetical protein